MQHGRFASEFGRLGTSGDSLKLRDPNVLPPNRSTTEQAFDSHVATIVFNGLKEKNSGILGAVIAVSILRSPWLAWLSVRFPTWQLAEILG